MSISENLKGRTILIGKEPSNGRLMISVNIKGGNKNTAIGEMGSVPNCVSRCKPAENVAHCKVEIDSVGNLILMNGKPQNTTYVNGSEIMSKKIKADAKIELGVDRYRLNLCAVLEAAAKLVDIVVPKEYSISHLEQVWNEYNTNIKQIKMKQQRVGVYSSIPMGLSMLGGLVAGVAPQIRTAALIFTGVAFVFLLLTLFLRTKDKSIEKTEEVTDHFQNKYICPKCKHFMGMQSYKILRQNKKCPYCGCLLTDK